MNNFLNKITAWFKPQSTLRKRTSPPKLRLEPKIKSKLKKPYSFNSRYYRQLIGQLASRTIAIERRRIQQNKEKNEKETANE